MNHIGGPVKTKAVIHERERDTMGRMSGRKPDDPVAWYCHMRIHEMLSAGTSQKRIAEIGNIPKSAVNLLVKHARGVGPTTAAGFAKVLGFATRGGLTDAADEWWAVGGSEYVATEMREMARERRVKAAQKKRTSSFPPAPSAEKDDAKTG